MNQKVGWQGFSRTRMMAEFVVVLPVTSRHKKVTSICYDPDPHHRFDRAPDEMDQMQDVFLARKDDHQGRDVGRHGRRCHRGGGEGQVTFQGHPMPPPHFPDRQSLLRWRPAIRAPDIPEPGPHLGHVDPHLLLHGDVQRLRLLPLQQD